MSQTSAILAALAVLFAMAVLGVLVFGGYALVCLFFSLRHRRKAVGDPAPDDFDYRTSALRSAGLCFCSLVVTVIAVVLLRAQ